VSRYFENVFETRRAGGGEAGRRLTQQVETGVENGQRRLVIVRFPDGLDEHWHVTAEVVHPEQERADGGRPDRHRHRLHEYGEQDAEPHFGCTQTEQVFF